MKKIFLLSIAVTLAMQAFAQDTLFSPIKLSPVSRNFYFEKGIQLGKKLSTDSSIINNKIYLGNLITAGDSNDSVVVKDNVTKQLKLRPQSAGNNFANADLTFTGNRFHNLNGDSLKLFNGKRINITLGDTNYINSLTEIIFDTTIFQLYHQNNLGSSQFVGVTIPNRLLALSSSGTLQGAEIDLDSSGLVTIFPSLRYVDGNEAAGKVLTSDVDGIATWQTPTTVSSGTYTPTLFNVTNIAASTAYQCQYLRVGNSVTVSGKVDIDVTLGIASELGMSLPIASNITAEENAGGTASSAAAESLVSAVRGDAANNRAAFVFTAVSLTNDSYFFEFTYLIQ